MDGFLIHLSEGLVFFCTGVGRTRITGMDGFVDPFIGGIGVLPGGAGMRGGGGAWGEPQSNPIGRSGWFWRGMRDWNHWSTEEMRTLNIDLSESLCNPGLVVYNWEAVK
jgi:hypothetical protein